MRIRHIIWDWNGTLLNDTSAAVAAVNAMLSRRGLRTLDVERYRRTFGFPVRDFYRTAGFRLESEDWDALAEEFHREFLSCAGIALHEHAVETLRGLRSEGIAHSLLSVSEQVMLESMLASFSLEEHFQHVQGVSNLYGESKLEAGAGLMRRINLPREQVVLVGDSLHDHEVASALKIRCLLVSHGHQCASRLERCAATVVADLRMIPALLGV